VKLILKQDVERLGEVGAVVEVSSGYARNYLLPRGLAVIANPEAEKQVLAAKRRQETEEDVRQRGVVETARALDGRAVHIRAKVNEAGRLFGSVGPTEIAAAILGEHGVSVEERCILVEEPFRTPDVYPVKLRFSPELESEIKVWVLEE